MTVSVTWYEKWKVGITSIYMLTPCMSNSIWSISVSKISFTILRIMGSQNWWLEIQKNSAIERQTPPFEGPMILRGMYCNVLYIPCSSVRSWIKLMQNPLLGTSNLFHMGLFPILNLGLSLETNRCLKYFLVVHADSSWIFYLATPYVTG